MSNEDERFLHSIQSNIWWALGFAIMCLVGVVVLVILLNHPNPRWWFLYHYTSAVVVIVSFACMCGVRLLRIYIESKAEIAKLRKELDRMSEQLRAPTVTLDQVLEEFKKNGLNNKILVVSDTKRDTQPPDATIH